MLRTALGYVVAVVVTYVAGVVAASAHVVGRFEAMAGESLSLSERFSWAAKDVAGMLLPPIYPLAIAVMILIAFAVAGFVIRRLIGGTKGKPIEYHNRKGKLRWLGFVLAGALGMVGLHLTLNAVFEINSIAASRDLLGLIGQALAGALGGIAYLLVHPNNSGESQVATVNNDRAVA